MTGRWTSFLLCLAAVLWLGGCAHHEPRTILDLRQQLSEVRNQGGAFCAPDSFAAAEAYLDFAADAYAAGDRAAADDFTRRATDHLGQARIATQGCETDLDADSVPDVKDCDPYRAEDFDDFEDSDGCPEDDNDGDGYLDREDECPDAAEDFDGFEDNDGCPDNDNDFDGVPDDRDKCPGEPEDIDGWQDEDGCPDPDNDGDQFPDVDDACPDHPEVINGFLDDDGCPDQLPTRRKMILLPEVEFLGGSVYMSNESRENLRRFAARLAKNNELHVRIESHTFKRGDENAALELTRQRAQAVKNLLVEFGVAPARVTALGFGDQRPIADNETFNGRRKNDRVDFIIYLP